MTFTNEELTQIYGTGLFINNNNPKTNFEKNNYYRTGFTLDSTAKATYYVPVGWTRDEQKTVDPASGAYVEPKCSKTGIFMNQVYDETTYEAVINAFFDIVGIFTVACP